MKPLAILGMAAALAMQPTMASAQGGDRIKFFTLEELQRALDAIGATYVDAGDDRSINITFKSTLLANGLVMSCEDQETELNCYGTSILAVFDPAPGTSEQDIANAITQYNYNENFGRAYVDPSGDISVRIYIIADGGITRENYRRQIELWSQSLEYFTTYLYPAEPKKKD